MAEFILVLVLEAIDTGSAIKLSAQHFVGLAETVQFGCQVNILALETSCMLLKGILFSLKVGAVVSVLTVEHTLAFYIAAAHKESFFFFFQTNFCVSNLTANVAVASFLEVNFFTEVVVLSSYALVVSADGGIISCKARISVADTSEFTLGILKLRLLDTKVSLAHIDQFLSIFDAGLSTGHLEVQTLQPVVLFVGFVLFGLVKLFQTCNFPPHLCALHLDALNVALQILHLGTCVSNLVSSGDRLVAKTACFEVLFVQETFGSGLLISQLSMLAGLVLEEELEVIQLFASICNFISATVKALSVLHFTSSLVVRKHTVAVLHGEDFVAHSSVVAVLVAKSVQLLAEVSDKLVLFGASDFDSGSSFHSRHIVLLSR